MSAAIPQRYGALTVLVAGLQFTTRSRNGGQEMGTNKQPQKRPWIIAGLVMLTLLSTAMTGCQHQQAVSGTVNSTFVDVDGLLAAPTKVVTSYPTEELNMGNDNSAGIPQFLDGVLYTFSYHSDLSQWTTAWDQATGKKLWSVATNASVSMSPYTTFTTDGKHLFFVRADMFKSGDPGVVASIACLDKTTGATVWQSIPAHASSRDFNILSNIAVRIDEQKQSAQLYIIGQEYLTSTYGSTTTAEVLFPNIWTSDVTTGTFHQELIAWPGGTARVFTSGGRLLSNGTTLYASIPESTPSASSSMLVAINLDTNKILWSEQVNGEVTDLIKQGDRLVALLSNNKQERSIDVWKIRTGSFDKTERLWTRQIDTNPAHFAVDEANVYLQGSNGVLVALDLVTGKEAWRHQFASYKMPIREGPDTGKLSDVYPDMTLTATRDVLYVQDGGGLVAALDLVTGKELWNKRISQVVWNQTSVDNTFVLQPVDKGFFVIASDGKVDLWQ
jgi:outer membrane protein assembly factor BamB